MKVTTVVLSAATLAGLVCLSPSQPAASDTDNAKESAELISALLVAGRGVVAQHQAKINDPNVGDKGFTPEYVDGLIRKAFEESHGTSIDSVEPVEVRTNLLAFLDASQEAVRNNQDRINAQGVAFKGFIPAVYGRITGNILKGKTGIELKQTAFKFRNAYNEPDAFESKVLAEFQQTKPTDGYGEVSAGHYRYLRPIYIKEACLSCHGEPKGELDIAGKQKEGYQVGDLRGAISVSVPVSSDQAHAH